MAKKPDDDRVEIHIPQLAVGKIKLGIIGTSPLITNPLSEKAKRDLLMPPRSKNKTERATTLKHDPIAEFRNSTYQMNDGPTLLGLPSTAFKKSMSNAALRLPGVKKTEIGQLCWVEGYRVPLFGRPMLFMSPVIQAGISRAPDIRTRSMYAPWAAMITISYVRPQLNEQTLISLLAAAGVLMGVGDFRQEKGSGSFGQFEVRLEDDPELLQIIADTPRDVQQAALERPEPVDAESGGLLDFYLAEAVQRGFMKSTEAARFGYIRKADGQ